MKIKTLIPFLVILALLVGLVIWQKINVKPQVPLAQQVKLESLVTEGLNKENIQRIELFSGEKPDEKVVLVKEGDEWRIPTLFNALANKETVTEYVEKLLSLKGEPRANADTEERLKNFSLTDQEAFHVCAYRANSESPDMNVLFGKSADFRTVFLRKAGDNRVFVEATNLRREAGASDSGEGAIPKATKFLKTTLLELKDDKINKVALKYPDKEIVFTRIEEVKEPEQKDSEGEGESASTEEKKPEVTYKWTLTQGGFSSTFKEQEVKTLLSRFANLTITNVVDPEKKAEWGFDPPQFTLTISREGEPDVVLLGGKDKPGGEAYVQLVGSEPPLIYQMSKYNFEQMFLQGSKLFTLPEWSNPKDSLRSIKVSKPEGVIAIERENDTWKVTEPKLNLETQKTAIDNLVTVAASMKPVDYADPTAEVGPFDTTVTILLQEGTTRTLHVGQPTLTVDGRYVKFDDSDNILVVSRFDAEKLMPVPKDMFVLSVLDFDAEKVAKISMSGDGTSIELNRTEGSSQWTGTYNGSPIQPSPELVDDLIFALNDFQVDNFLLDRTLDSVVPASNIKVTTLDGTETVVLVSAAKDGIYEMTISGMPYVFTATLFAIKSITDEVMKFASLVAPQPEPQPADQQETAEGEVQQGDEGTAVVLQSEGESASPVEQPEAEVSGTENAGESVAEGEAPLQQPVTDTAVSSPPEQQ